jgi:hypothetical protein
MENIKSLNFKTRKQAYEKWIMMISNVPPDRIITANSYPKRKVFVLVTYADENFEADKQTYCLIKWRQSDNEQI